MTQPQSKRLRIGAILHDTLRMQGFAALFRDIAETIPLQPAEAVRRSDLSLVVLDGNEQLFPLLAALHRARAPLRVLVLGESTDPVYISRVIAAGAKGYLPNSASHAEMSAALHVVADGSIWAPRKVLSSLIDTLSLTEPVRPPHSFTPRERQLLERLIQGRPDRDIAADLQLSVRTVQAMVRNLLKRVGVSNRVALTVYVMERHLLR